MKDSELILNDDESIYHLALKPNEIAPLIITVGDPKRVQQVSQHFDTVDIIRSNREFLTHTGRLNGKQISCISTGMGSDNIDIVVNELDALVNVDFETRSHKSTHTQLTLVRIGTSGSITQDVKIDQIIYSSVAIGLEGLMLWYAQLEMNLVEKAWMKALMQIDLPIKPFVCAADASLVQTFETIFKAGITLTTAGFYAPQSRSLRLATHYDDIIGDLSKINVDENHITNIEMETAAIYGLTKALGHKAISINAILAHRISGEFSKNAQRTIETAITKSLDALCK